MHACLNAACMACIQQLWMPIAGTIVTPITLVAMRARHSICMHACMHGRMQDGPYSWLKCLRSLPGTHMLCARTQAQSHAGPLLTTA